MDTLCKMTVLQRLLREGRVSTWELSREMAEAYGSGFDVEAFNNACGVIKDYCETSHDGTGLPVSEEMDSEGFVSNDRFND